MRSLALTVLAALVALIALAPPALADCAATAADGHSDDGLCKVEPRTDGSFTIFESPERSAAGKERGKGKVDPIGHHVSVRVVNGGAVFVLADVYEGIAIHRRDGSLVRRLRPEEILTEKERAARTGPSAEHPAGAWCVWASAVDLTTRKEGPPRVEIGLSADGRTALLFTHTGRLVRVGLEKGEVITSPEALVARLPRLPQKIGPWDAKDVGTRALTLQADVAESHIKYNPRRAGARVYGHIRIFATSELASEAHAAVLAQVDAHNTGKDRRAGPGGLPLGGPKDPEEDRVWKLEPRAAGTASPYHLVTSATKDGKDVRPRRTVWRMRNVVIELTSDVLDVAQMEQFSGPFFDQVRRGVVEGVD